MTLRVAVVTHSEVEGGAEVYLRRLYRELPDVEPMVFGRLPGWTGDVEDLDLTPKWGRRTLLPGLLRVRSERRRVRLAVEGFRPDVVHLQFKREQIGFTRSLAEIAPVVWTEHGVMPRGMRLALGSAYRRAAREVTTVIPVSNVVGRQIGRLVGHERIRVIENGVDASGTSIPTPAARERARRELGVDEGPLAVWVGRLDVGKRPELAIDLLRRWEGSLVMAGDGPLREHVEIGAAGNPRVHYVGHVDPTRLYQAADVLLVTSDGRSEGLPNVLLEAACFGVPAVATDAVVLRDPVLASGGLVVTGADQGEWVDALRRVIGDGSRRAAARTWAERHDLAHWSEQHREVLVAAAQGRANS